MFTVVYRVAASLNGLVSRLASDQQPPFIKLSWLKPDRYFEYWQYQSVIQDMLVDVN